MQELIRGWHVSAVDRKKGVYWISLYVSCNEILIRPKHYMLNKTIVIDFSLSHSEFRLRAYFFSHYRQISV